MKKFLPVVIAILGLGGGVVAGTIMKPAQADSGEHASSDGHGEAKADAHGSDDGGHAAKADGDHGGGGGHGTADSGGHGEHGAAPSGDDYIYVGLKKPFFAPVPNGQSMGTLVRIDLHLELPARLEDLAHQHEPKLRDAFLKAVLNFSDDGGFARVHRGDGFSRLRDSLLVSAREILGPEVRNVLIGEILTREG